MNLINTAGIPLITQIWIKFNTVDKIFKNMLDKFRSVKQDLEDKEYVIQVVIDEEFIPPHKSAAFTPYDCIVCIDYQDNVTVTGEDNYRDKDQLETIEDNIKQELSDDIYDRIINVVYNDTSEPGNILAYISLETFEEYKSRW